MAGTDPNSFDLVIVGGGLVGASLAAALDTSDLRIAMIEPFPADADDQPSYDERTVALTWSARQIFGGIGIWPAIEALGAEPIRDIHISNRGHFGVTHLSRDDAGTEALGYVVPTRVMGKVLAERLDQVSNLTRFQPAEATAISSQDTSAIVTIKQGEQSRELRASLVVLADGGRSGLSDDFSRKKDRYTQQAVLSIVRSDRAHHGRAYERFTDEGPLALLPHSDQRYAVVWTSEEASAASRVAMTDDEFILALQRSFGDRAGNLLDPSPRKAYPLGRNQVTDPVGNRRLVIGNAAHTVHPVAGQGFNLGLRDVAWLAELLFNEAVKGGDADIGRPDLLRDYARRRQRETRRVGQFTHGLIALFSNDNPVLGLARNTALGIIEHLPLAKRLLLNRTMGTSGKVSLLATGLPLDAAPPQTSE